MAIRTKTKKRLLVLLTIVMILTVGGTGAFLYRKKQRKERALRCRELGIQEIEQGELSEGMANLARYLREFPEDADVLYRLASARRRVGLPEGRHVHIAISLFRQAIDLDPTRPDAHRQLMELYAERGFTAETLGSANSLLDLVPGDPQALRMKVEVLCRLKRLEEAYETALELIEQKPDDLEAHVLTLYVLSRRHQRQAMLDRAAGLLKEHPDDVRYDLLNAVALAMANRRAQAEEELAKLSSRRAPDATFVRVFVRTYDSLGRYEDSLARLRELTPDLRDSGLRKDLVRRLWEGGLVEEVETELATLDPAAGETDSELLAFLAYARIELGRKEAAEPILDVLAARKFDATARAWEGFLRALAAEEAPSDLELVGICHEAGSLDPKNPYIDYALGDAYYRLGEYELAVEFWKKASKIAPTWAMPHVGIARARVLLGERKRGLKDIAAAFRRARYDPRVAVPWVVAGGETDTEALDTLIETFPQTPENLAVRVSLLVRAGRRDEAEALVREVLAREPAPEEGILMGLASVCRAAEIPLEDACLDRIESAHGLTADLAYARTIRLEAKEGKEAALAYLESAYPGREGDVGLAWALVWARYLDRARDERALEAFRALTDRWTEDLAAQRAVLEARATRQDRDLFGRAVENLKELTGERALRWRVYRAQWLLDDPAADEKVFTEASRLLSDVIEIAPEFVKARYLMARALENLQDVSGSIEQLEKAVKVDPDSTVLRLEMARLKQREGDFKGAQESLAAITANGDAPPLFVRAAALLLARQGNLRAAVDALESLSTRGAGAKSPMDDVLLLRWYARLAEWERAEALCEELLTRKDTASLTAVALYLRSRGLTEEAQEAIRTLDSLDLEPPQKELALASYHRLVGDLESALGQYRKATQAAPASPRCWVGRIVMAILVGRTEEGHEAIAEARRALPDEELFAFLARNDRLVVAALADPRLRPFLVAAIEDARERTPFLETAALIADARSRGAPAERVRSDLRGLARRHVGSLPLQILVIRDLLGAGEAQAAATLGQKAMGEFPQSGIAAQLAATALAQAGNMKEAHRAALEWRLHSFADALSADVLLAKIEVKQGEPEDAFRRLEPYLTRLSTLARGDDDLMLTSVGVLIASGRVSMAAQLLEPLLAESPVWRRRWIGIAAEYLGPEASAAWLGHAEKVVPAGSVDEQLELVRAWCVAWHHHKREPFIRAAEAIVDRLSAGGGAPASVLFARGMIAEELRDAKLAEKSYREALELDDSLAAAHNNLAMILVGRKEYAEALPHAKRAAEHEEPLPDFHDTLAIVLSALGKHDLAAEALRKAVALDPKAPDWRLSLVRELIASGQIPEAREALHAIDAIRPSGRDFEDDVELRLTELRDELADKLAEKK